MQKDYKTDTWKEFNEVIKDKKLYLFGVPGAKEYYMTLRNTDILGNWRE